MLTAPSRATLGIRGVLVLLAILVLAACRDSDDTESVSGFDGAIFGTFYEVTLRGTHDDAGIEALHTGVRDQLEAVDATMSTYRADSELNRLNNTPVGEWKALTDGLYEVLASSREVARQTGGAFDVTVGGLVNLWGFGPEGRPREMPPPELVNAHRANVGYHLLELDEQPRAARRQADFRIDVSAIAKGYAVDAVAAWLDEQEEEHYLINIGGDLLARGRRNDDQAWRIGIEHPGADEPMVLPLADMAIATSGDYRNYFEHDGSRYSHIIDPRTGYPTEHQLASATVLHESNALANAYATAMMAMGASAAMALAERHGLKALLITRDGEEFRTQRSPAFR